MSSGVRDDLLAAGLAVFDRSGFEGATVAAIRAKAGRPTHLRLAEELMAAYQRQGEAMSKREQTIKMAEANKAFSHFAW